jgi:hypothetical protein
MRELNRDELAQVSGGFNPLAGGAIGGLSYLAVNAMTGQEITTAGFSASVTLGAVTSGLSAIGGPLTGTANMARNFHAASIGSLSSAAAYGAVSSVGGGGSNRTTGSHIMDKHK